MAEPADSLPRESFRRRPAAVSDLFLRSAGAPLVGGNRVSILRDGEQNYPAWIQAIEGASRTIHLDMYIVHDDGIGRRFRDLLVAKARQGVAVRVLYDWFGALRLSSFRFWAPLTAAGGEARLVNPPRWDTLLDIGARDHRKLLTVDGRIAFISGLCIGDDWLGDPGRDLPPWRDTGVAVEGPAVAAAEAAFIENWGRWGTPLPVEPAPVSGASRDDRVRVTVVPTSPDRTSVYRYELAALGVAQQRMWLADAYFMATSTYMEALRAAARDGVDVRLLVPHNSDVQWLGNFSRTLYRRLLSAGVRIFEWNGPMMHAKTSVTDGYLVRVGSTNLNVTSWIGNWELDVVIDDPEIGAEMEAMYEEDLRNATEIVVTERNKIRLTAPPERTGRAAARRRHGRFATAASGSANRVLKDVALARSVVGSAVKGYRVLGRHEASALLFFAAVAAALAAVAWFWPKAIAWPVAVVSLLLVVALTGKGLKLWYCFRKPDEVRQASKTADSAD